MKKAGKHDLHFMAEAGITKETIEAMRAMETGAHGGMTKEKEGKGGDISRACNINSIKMNLNAI